MLDELNITIRVITAPWIRYMALWQAVFWNFVLPADRHIEMRLLSVHFRNRKFVYFAIVLPIPIWPKP